MVGATSHVAVDSGLDPIVFPPRLYCGRTYGPRSRCFAGQTFRRGDLILAELYIVDNALTVASLTIRKASLSVYRRVGWIWKATPSDPNKDKLCNSEK